MSVEECRSVARSVASRSPCDAQERTSVVAPATKVVPPPSVCSTAVGPPRRISPPPGRPPLLPRTPAPPDGEHWSYDSNWRSPYRPLLKSPDHHPQIFLQFVPRRSGVLVCQTSQYTPDVGIPALPYPSAGVRDSVGTVSTLPDPHDTAGVVPLSPVVDGYPPCHHSVPLSGHHGERSRRLATRSRYPVPGGCL